MSWSCCSQSVLRPTKTGRVLLLAAVSVLPKIWSCVHRLQNSRIVWTEKNNQEAECNFEGMTIACCLSSLELRFKMASTTTFHKMFQSKSYWCLSTTTHAFTSLFIILTKLYPFVCWQRSNSQGSHLKLQMSSCRRAANDDLLTGSEVRPVIYETFWKVQTNVYTTNICLSWAVCWIGTVFFVCVRKAWSQMVWFPHKSCGMRRPFALNGLYMGGGGDVVKTHLNQL